MVALDGADELLDDCDWIFYSIWTSRRCFHGLVQIVKRCEDFAVAALICDYEPAEGDFKHSEGLGLLKISSWIFCQLHNTYDVDVRLTGFDDCQLIFAHGPFQGALWREGVLEGSKKDGIEVCAV